MQKHLSTSTGVVLKERLSLGIVQTFVANYRVRDFCWFIVFIFCVRELKNKNTLCLPKNEKLFENGLFQKRGDFFALQ